MKTLNNCATLSNAGDFSVFSFGNHTIKFRTSPMLEHYTRIVEWDDSYIVVMAKYRNRDSEEEEYIDLIPILKNLYFDAEKFLKPIKKVRVQNA